MRFAKAVAGIVIAFLPCLGQTTSTGLVGLLSPDEFRRAGLNKLTAGEIQSLNAALMRILLETGSGTQTTQPSVSANRANNTSDFFDSKGNAVAYFDDDDTLYLWSGEPVAYMDEDSLFGFNGKHLGWRKDGAIYDHDGNVVAAIVGRFKTPVSAAPSKAFKEFKPFKGFKEFKPFKPFFGATWSDLPARSFFLQGTR